MGSAIRLEDVATKIDHKDADFHRETISDILRRSNTKFPGAQPVSFARKHLRELERHDYYVAEKTDGIRCLLFLTSLHPPNSPPIEAQFLIDRKNDYYYIERGYLHIPPPIPPQHQKAAGKIYSIEQWHIGTILDGELVRDTFKDGTSQLTYLIFDILALDGQNICDRLFDVRIGKLNEFILKPYKAFKVDWPDEVKVQPFQISLKKPQLPYVLDSLFKEIIPNLDHGNDGLIFTCKETPYAFGTDDHVLKWKPPHENTVDFRLKLGMFPMEEDDDGPYEDYDQKPEFTLQVFHGNNDYKDFATLFLTDDEWEAMKSMGQQFDNRIIECWRDASTERWRPKLDGKTPRFRDDKENANHYTVVKSVIESIEDAVSEEELLSSRDRVRNAWKAREAQRKQEKERAKMQQQQQQHQQQPKQEDDGPRYVD